MSNQQTFQQALAQRKHSQSQVDGGQKESFQGAIARRHREKEQDDDDIMSHLLDVPAGVVAGFRDAAQSIANLGADAFTAFFDIKTLDEQGKLISAKEEVRESVQLPEGPETKTLTGDIVKPISQFLIPFAGAVKGVQAVGKAAPFVAGAVTDFVAFDEHEKRLSDLVESVPSLSNPVTDYLKADITDSVAEGRFKNAVEGALAGGAVAALGSALVKGAKYIKHAKKAKETVFAAKKRIDQAKLDFDSKQFRPDKEVISEKVQRNLVQDLDVGADDVLQKKVLKEIQATGYDKKLTKATILQEKQFEKIKNTLPDYMARASLGDRKAADDFFYNEFLKYAEFDGAVKDLHSDIARSMSLRGKSQSVTTVNELVKKVEEGGIKTKNDLMKAFAGVVESGSNPQVLVDNMKAQGNWKDLPFKAFVNSLLSGPKTLMVDTLSNPLWHTYLSVERGVAAGVGSIRKGIGKTMSPETLDKLHAAKFFGGDQVAYKESAILLDRYAASVKDGFRYIAKAFKHETDRAQKFAQSGKALSPIKDIGKQFKELRLDSQTRFESTMAIKSASELLGMQKGSLAARMTDGFEMIAGGYATPYMRAKDDVAKMMAYRAEVHALAHRQAAAEGLTGKAYSEKIKALTDVPLNQAEFAQRNTFGRMLENVKSGNDDAFVSDQIGRESLAFARESTFTKELGDLGQTAQKLVSKFPGGKYILPFVKTPANLIKQFTTRTVLAPLSKNIRAEILAGGARADQALARISMGSGLMYIAYEAALNGRLTGEGPKNKAERDALLKLGWRPRSIRIGDKYIEYGRLDPLASFLGTAANIVEAVDALDDDLSGKLDRDMSDYVQLSILKLSNMLLNKSFTRGLAETVEVLVNEEERSFDNLVSFLSSSVVPNNVAFITNEINPYMQATTGTWEKIQSKVGVNVRHKLDIFGEKIKRDPQMLGYLIPSSHSNVVHDGIHKDLADMGVYLPMPKRRINGVELSMDQHHQLMTIVKEIGTKEAISRVIPYAKKLPAIERTGIPGYQTFTQKGVMKEAYNRMIKKAREILLLRNPELAVRVEERNVKLTEQSKRAPQIDRVITIPSQNTIRLKP